MIIIKGEVIHGAQLGRKMGFPTANLDACELNDIENGVYRSTVIIDGATYRAMSNIGLRPSVDGRCRLDKIRDEKRFGSIDELRRQLEHDADVCRNL